MLDQTKLQNIQTQMTQKKAKQKGASMIEYALVVAAVVGIGAIFFNSTNGTITSALNTKLTNVATDIKK